MRASKAQRRPPLYVTTHSLIDIHPPAYLFIVKNELETRAKELTAEESEIADQRDRLEAERAIDFFDELGSDVVSARFSCYSAKILIPIPSHSVCEGCSRDNAIVSLPWRILHKN